MVKPLPTTLNGEDNAPRAEQLSGEALYEQRLEAIYEDAQAERCSFGEATDRVVAAIVARTSGWFTPRGHAELEAIVRHACARDPRLRKAL